MKVSPRKVLWFTILMLAVPALINSVYHRKYRGVFSGPGSWRPKPATFRYYVQAADSRVRDWRHESDIDTLWSLGIDLPYYGCEHPSVYATNQESYAARSWK